MMRPTLTIYVFATDKDLFESCIRSIAESELEGKTQLLVMYTLEVGWLKNCLSNLLKTKQQLTITCKKVKSYYGYPFSWVQNFHLRWLFRFALFYRRVTPYRENNIRLQIIAYQQSVHRTRGRYLLILPQEMRLKKDFWQYGITPLEQNPKATILVASVERNNSENIDYLNRSISDKTELFQKGKGILPFLLGTQLVEKIIIVKRARIKWIKTRYLSPDYASDRYIFDHCICCRLALSAGMLTNQYVAEADITETERNCYESIEILVLRLAFLKGYNWHYDFPHGYKYSTNDLKEAYGIALKELKTEVIKIEQYYNNQNRTELASRFKAFSNAIS